MLTENGTDDFLYSFFTVDPDDQEQAPYPPTREYLNQNYNVNKLPHNATLPRAYLPTAQDLRDLHYVPRQPEYGPQRVQRRKELEAYMMGVGIVLAAFLFWVRQMVFSYRNRYY